MIPFIIRTLSTVALLIVVGRHSHWSVVLSLALLFLSSESGYLARYKS